MPRRRAPVPPVDVNIQVAGLLADMSAIQASPQRKWAYKQAAAAIRALEQPLDDLAAAHGAVPRIPGIGPSSTRVIDEVLAGGASPTVEQAVDHSGQRVVIDQARALRQGFLSRAAVATVLAGAGRYRATPATSRCTRPGVTAAVAAGGDRELPGAGLFARRDHRSRRRAADRPRFVDGPLSGAGGRDRRP